MAATYLVIYISGPNSIERDSTNYAPLSAYSTISNVLQIGVSKPNPLNPDSRNNIKVSNPNLLNPGTERHRIL